VLCCVDDLVVGGQRLSFPRKISPYAGIVTLTGSMDLHRRFKWDGNVLHYLADQWSKVR
jgi:hypothetical protein